MNWHPLLIALLLVLSQAALFAGFAGIHRRRPLVITGPGVALALVAVTIALLGACGWMVIELDHSGAAMAGFVFAAVVCLLLVRAVHAAESSCIVIGTTGRWVRHALCASCFRMSIPFRDEHVDKDISSGRNAVRVLHHLAGYQPVHLVRARNQHLAPYGAELAREMDAYFTANTVYTDTAAFRAMTAAGVVLLVAAIYVWLRWFAG